jgi:protein involved in polysaccharide export with SLBB domain
MLLTCALVSANAQVGGSSSALDKMRQTQQAAETTALQEQKNSDMFPVGNIVDANVYRVGPNDVLSIQVIPIDVVAKLVTVTSECSIVHQLFGEVSVRGMTLKQVRDSLSRRLSNGDSKMQPNVVISLIQPRKVFVSIRGNVISPGTYTLPASYSVSTAVKFANQAQTTTGLNTEEQSALSRLQESRKEREKIFSESGVAETSSFGTRNIRLIRGSGASIVDIERAKVTQDQTYDPSICEGDDIFVPFEEAEYPTITIAGEIIRPATLVLKTGDMASHLLKMGYGFTQNADLNNVQLFTAASAEPQKLIVDSAMNLISNDVELTPGTAIIVGVKPIQKPAATAFVSVKGEVKNPNIYMITLGKTTLLDAINMAGGITDSAYLPLATIGRRDNSQNDRVPIRRKYNEYFQYSNMTQQDTMRFNIAMDMKKPIVSCDFVSAMDSSKEHNILLQDGDVIDIPNKPHKVNVFGQVNNPGYVDFVEGQTMQWYINKAGGYATNAAPDRARIIRGSNHVWVNGFDKEVYVYDGDEIFVSAPRDVPPEMELQKWAAISGIAGVILSFISIAWGIYNGIRNN